MKLLSTENQQNLDISKLVTQMEFLGVALFG